jgi:hypothetical protein
MYSPYRPNLDSPDVANPFEAETFEAREFRVLGFGKGGVKLGLKGIGARFGSALRTRLKPALKNLFKSKRAIRKTLTGLPEETIEKALKNPDEAADALATVVAKEMNIISGTEQRTAMKSWMNKLPSKQDDLVITNGKWIAPDGTEYSKEFVDIFYKADGGVRKPEFAEAIQIGEGGKVLKGSGATSEMDDALKSLAKGDKFPDNPVKKSMDDLVSDSGKLSDEAIEEITEKAIKSDDFIKALDDNIVSPRPSLSTQSADDVAKRALGTKSKFGLGIAAIVVGGWVANNLLSDFASRLWGDDCTREKFEDKFPNASDDELDAKVEECLDQAAKRIMYLGAAGMGVGLLILLFITSRIFQKKKSTVIEG